MSLSRFLVCFLTLVSAHAAETGSWKQALALAGGNSDNIICRERCANCRRIGLNLNSLPCCVNPMVGRWYIITSAKASGLRVESDRRAAEKQSGATRSRQNLDSDKEEFERDEKSKTRSLQSDSTPVDRTVERGPFETAPIEPDQKTVDFFESTNEGSELSDGEISNEAKAFIKGFAQGAVDASDSSDTSRIISEKIVSEFESTRRAVEKAVNPEIALASEFTRGILKGVLSLGTEMRGAVEQGADAMNGYLDGLQLENRLKTLTNPTSEK